MSVLSVMKWNINPAKTEKYEKWAQSAIKRTLEAPGVVEFRSYRATTGDFQVIVTHEFADLNAWANWQANEEVQKVNEELYTVATNIQKEVWGPSPVAPKPIRPGG